ncbi:T-cell surface glycoprotein CD3 epsilon chain [Nothobranchius furzeri]|uniref:T-cell surface glycoprotein CD3 epsilon chain n=1 Tax=Nothobranchius furzeri TaxID=105023 RepID=UPI0039047785
MDVQAAFAVLLMFAATVNADGEASASFRGSEVTLTCPFDGAWYDKDTKLSETDAYTFQYEVPVQYDCKTSTGRLYQFYVRGLACDNCFELDAFLFIGMVTADVIVSTVLMIIIYRCNRKTSSDAAPHPAKSPAKAPGRAPPIPHPDYAPLNPNTRSMGTYSTVVTKMG